VSFAGKEVGRRGEALARAHLESLGYQIQGQNLSFSRGELDLVALSPEGILCFVEVKTDRFAGQHSAALRVGVAKKRQIHAVAQQYLQRGLAPAHQRARFDVVSVVLEPEPQVQLFADAFVPIFS
jgi:putative endonuclease